MDNICNNSTGEVKQRVAQFVGNPESHLDDQGSILGLPTCGALIGPNPLGWGLKEKRKGLGYKSKR